MRPSRLRTALTAAALGPVLAWTLFPIYWITTASFKTELTLYARPPQWLFTPILDNYTRVLTNIPFMQYLKNSRPCPGQHVKMQSWTQPKAH